jgi:hypothetical protein
MESLREQLFDSETEEKEKTLMDLDLSDEEVEAIASTIATYYDTPKSFLDDLDSVSRKELALNLGLVVEDGELRAPEGAQDQDKIAEQSLAMGEGLQETKRPQYTDEEMHDLWRKHQETPDDDYEARNEIMRALQGYEYTAVQPYKKTGVPTGLMHSKARHEMAKAIEDWDPNHESGAPLRSHVWKRLHPIGRGHSVVNRVVRKYGDINQVRNKNMSRMDKARELKKEFREQNGRSPSVSELADLMNIEEDDANVLMREMSPVHYTDQLIDDDQSLGELGEEEIDAVRTVYHSMTGRNKRILEALLYPTLGGEKPEGYDQHKNNWPHQGSIAEEVGVSPSTVSRVKDRARDQVIALL